ncbi:MAG: DNA adenine methylase [Sphaerochaetaceae bacterium]|nr:DNA adenine methylase [Spirochaetales bacterium]MDY5498673.1 DNA adenine methylase [Sphaerochaetaceae bacterium]
MNGTIPTIVQYQGSKRKLAPQILQYMPKHIKRLVEPFSGMAAISVAVAYENRADRYYINDLNEPLVKMLEEAINNPQQLIEEYSRIWNEQFDFSDDHVKHFYIVRERFNAGERTPANILYLIARCVKGAVRYGIDGKFNQSPDKRRHGTNPKNLEKNVYAISSLLKGKTEFSALDYKKVFELVEPGDLVYMDPPYQGVTNVRDNRYFSGVPFDEFADALQILNDKGIDYIVSYDGECGGKEYGEDLPESLGCKKVMLNAGLSSQALLLGKKSTTFEALYISKELIPFFRPMPEQMTMFRGEAI